MNLEVPMLVCAECGDVIAQHEIREQCTTQQGAPTVHRDCHLDRHNDDRARTDACAESELPRR